MRLDHLLSKEHLTLSGVQNPDRERSFLAGSSWVEHLTWCEGCCSSLVRRIFGSGWNGEGGGCRTCTLLGPEGPDAHWPSGWVHSRLLWTFCRFPFGGCGKGYRPYFENYTVDASILQLIVDQLHKMILKIISQFQIPPFGWGRVFDSNSCDFKSLRANGGCLGIWSRRRT